MNPEENSVTSPSRGDGEPVGSAESDPWTGAPGIARANAALPAFVPEDEIAASANSAAEQEVTVGQTFARLLRLEEIVRNLIPAQKRRSDKIEQRIDGLEEALQGQIADIETGYKTAAAAVESRLMDRVLAVVTAIEGAEAARAAAEKRALDAETQANYVRIHQDAYRQAWQAAPLILRLRFVRELLPAEHASHNVLKEAAALEELRRRGQDLETWLTNYPSLFADAMQSLDAGAGANVAAPSAHDTNPVDILAAQTVSDARAALETTLQAMGVTWIAPSPGDSVLAEHEVILEDPSPNGEGRVAKLRRRGFRVQGRLAIPAQINRTVMAGAAAPAESKAAAQIAVSTAGETGYGAPRSIAGATPTDATTAATWKEPRRGVDSLPSAVPATEVPEPEGASVDSLDPTEPVSAGGGHSANGADAAPAAAKDLPDWLRMLGQRTFGCELPAVSAFADQITALSKLPGRIAGEIAENEARAIVTDAMRPLLPLLGLRYADGLPGIPETWGAVFLDVREPLSAWLKETLELCALVPVRGARFDPQTMEAVETRRTVHANENETVSRVERVGLIWRGRPLMRAEVVRYASEGTP